MLSRWKCQVFLVLLQCLGAESLCHPCQPLLPKSSMSYCPKPAGATCLICRISPFKSVSPDLVFCHFFRLSCCGCPIQHRCTREEQAGRERVSLTRVLISVSLDPSVWLVKWGYKPCRVAIRIREHVCTTQFWCLRSHSGHVCGNYWWSKLMAVETRL